MKYEYVFNDLSALEIEYKLRQVIDNALYEKYGDKPDERIKKRIIDEWKAMERSDTVLDVAALCELVIWLKKNNHPYWMRGCAGSSLILYLLGITFGNPLPPHYHCPVSHSIQWETGCLDGFDLPKKKTCEQDKATLIPDGHNVPWQTLWGYGEHIPVFHIDLPKNLRDDFLVLLENHWLRKKESDASVSLKTDSETLSLSNLRLTFRLDCSSIHAVIDDTLDGIDRSDVIVLGARVAMGKTAFALDVAYALATTANKKVAIFTPSDDVKNILEGLKRRAKTACPENISLWTGDALCIESLRNELNANGVDFLIIDCLQSFVGTKSAKQVEATMQGLRQLAKDKNVPMLILTQLSRKVERRKDHTPLVKDIPQFKSVVPFADSILLLYREAYYNPNADRSTARCFIAKNTRGGLGAIPLIWNDEKLGFENPAPSCYAE